MRRKFPNHPDIKTDTWQECQKRCAATEHCKFFTWHKRNNRFKNDCALSQTYGWKKKDSTVSGPRECSKGECQFIGYMFSPSFERSHSCFNVEYFPVCDGSEEPQVVGSTSYDCPGGTHCGRFPAKAVFSLADDGTARHNKFNFWLAPQKKAGPEQGFTLDLGCAKKAVGVRLKNTQNRPRFRDRGTKRFRLLGSSSGTGGPWQTLLEANLEDSRQQKPPPVKKLLFEKSLVVRFLKFQLLEFWGRGGGLQHLSVLTEDDAGDTFLENQHRHPNS